MLPSPFRSLRSLRTLNIAGVGLSLAAITSLVLGGITNEHDSLWLSAFVTGLPTLAVGVLWARLLRWKRTVGKSTLRVGWLLSIPLAMLNASLAAAVLLSQQSGQSRATNFLFGLLIGASYGAIIWIPALMLTLLLFGLPIAWSQRQAERGLSGEERGEGIVGLTVSVLSLGAVVTLLAIVWHHLNAATGVQHPPTEHAWSFLVPLGQLLTGGYAVGGLLAGVLACGLALSRERQRRQIVREAEAGRITGLRVDDTAEGKVLVRVSAQSEDYRVGDLEEELVALDLEGKAVRPLAATPDERRL